jgi:hypothetical protein
LRYASDELKDIYPDVSMALLEVAQQLISENNIKKCEIEEFHNLVEETIENANKLD